MDLAPICANSISCIDKCCLRRHAFYLTADERANIKGCIDYYWKSERLFKYRYDFPKKPNWCYDGNFCLNKNCTYDHLFDINGRNIICNFCKKDIEGVLIPVPE
jgi:hypothetical protein